jgi:hemoglobin-like flavoprotein
MLSNDEIALVRGSFAKVVPIKDAAADLFYSRLFEIAPQVRAMFPSDLTEQKQKLMAMIAAAVGGLDDLGALAPAVKALGARHAGYGTKPEHYHPVGEALLWTLDKGLGDGFTPDVEAAWTKVYGVLAATMQAGATEAAKA